MKKYFIILAIAISVFTLSSCGNLNENTDDNASENTYETTEENIYNTTNENTDDNTENTYTLTFDLNTPSYKVNFYLRNTNDELLYSQTVAAQVALQIPDNPVRQGYIFGGWMNADDNIMRLADYESINSDMSFVPYWIDSSDLFSDAEFEYMGSININETLESQQIYADRTAVYSFVPNSNGLVTIETDLQSGDPGLELYDEFFNLLASNDDIDVNQNNINAKVSANCEQNKIYYVLMKAYEKSAGTTDLIVSSSENSNIELYAESHITPIPVQTITSKNEIIYPENPIRDGYLFAGWYDNPEGTGEKFDFSSEINLDTTVYAKWAELLTNDKYVYAILNEGIYIVSYIYEYGYLSSEIIIPNMIDGLEVTAIGGGAFINNEFTSITIPNSVTTIGYYAFNWAEIMILNLGNNPNFIYENNLLLSADGTELIAGIGRLTNVIIPDSVAIIGYRAFFANYLTSVTIPESVIEIGDWAFTWNKLTSLTLPDSVATIGEWAFSGNELTSLTISNSVTTIDDWAFSYNALTSLTILGDETRFNDRWDDIKFPANLKP